MFIPRGRLLIYSTWLVLGMVEIVLGVEQLVNSWSGRASLYGQLLGAILAIAGTMLLWTSGKVARLQTEPLVKKIRVLTAVLAVFVFGPPLMLALVSSIAIITNGTGVDATHIRRLCLLGLIFMAYPIATRWAMRRLRPSAFTRSS